MSDDESDRPQRNVRLTPPPRIAPAGSKLAGRRRAPAIIPPVRRGRPRWVAPLAIGLGVLLAVAALLLWSLREGVVPFAATNSEPEAETAVLGGSSSPGTSDGATPPAPEAEMDHAPGSDGASAAPAAPRPRPSRPTAPRPAPAPADSAAERDAHFGRAMAEGLAAIDAGDWQTARLAFGRAATLDPFSPEPAAGLARLRAAEDRMALEELRQRAARRLEAEAWSGAAEDYRAALEIDPTLTFAREGLRVAEARGALFERLAFHIERPGRLAASEVLSEVELLLDRAREIDDPGPKHAAQIAALEGLAVQARLPVRVELVSDGQTEVTVYQVGRLGAFDRRVIELKPGTYTVVGSRPGYRDVRRELEIAPGAAPGPFEIRCEEKI